MDASPAITEYVSDAAYPAYRANARRLGLVITLSAPTAGGYYVTTVARTMAAVR